MHQVAVRAEEAMCQIASKDEFTALSIVRRIPMGGSAACLEGRASVTQRNGSLAVVLLVVLLVAMEISGFASTSPASAADTAGGGPQRIIIDSDLSLWWDDATAVGMANVLQQRGKVQILAVMSDIRNPQAAAALDAIDTAYGHGGIPVGTAPDSSADTAPHGYSNALAEQLPHAIRNSSQAQPAAALYRRLLAAQPDHSVTVVAIGGDTNLAGLLRSSPGHGSSLPGRALVARKFKKLVIEDGLFPTGGPPFTNERLDIAATQLVVGTQGWPTPIAWVDGFTGINTKVGGSLCSSVPRRTRCDRLPKALQLRTTGRRRLGRTHDAVRGRGRGWDFLRAGSGWCGGRQYPGWSVLGVRRGPSAGGVRARRESNHAQCEDQLPYREFVILRRYRYAPRC